jgi:hypothetical protein
MRKLLLPFLLLASTPSLAKVPSAPSPDIASRATAINAQSKSQLGVGLIALSLIVDAGPGHFFPKDMLVQNGSWLKYKELERAGYITLKVSDGLPDGSAAGTEFVTVVLTGKGQKLRAALLRP